MRHQCASSGQGVWSTRTDRDYIIAGGYDISGAAQEEEILAVEHNEHGFQASQYPIRTPFLGQFRGGAGEARRAVFHRVTADA